MPGLLGDTSEKSDPVYATNELVREMRLTAKIILWGFTGQSLGECKVIV